MTNASTIAQRLPLKRGGAALRPRKRTIDKNLSAVIYAVPVALSPPLPLSRRQNGSRAPHPPPLPCCLGDHRGQCLLPDGPA